MQHFDEGTLHAYLDGELTPLEQQRVDEHLAACAACRARFEEERALIRRAGDLLAALEPRHREPPPLTQLERHAGRRRARRRFGVPLPLAWAATVVLAVGAGWLARGSFMVQRGGGPTAELLIADSSPSPPPASPSPAPAATRDEPGRAPTTTQPSAPPPTLGYAAGAGAAADTSGRRLDAVRELAQGRAAEAPAPAPSVAARLEPARAQELQLQPGQVQSLLTDSTWQETSLEDASERLGAPLAVVPGLPIEKVEVSQGEARVTQRLSTEWVIRLNQRRATAQRQARNEERARALAAAPSAEFARADALAPPTRMVGTLEVTITSPAPVPTDSLARLLALARPRGSED